ncbi:MAG: hypothetical protein KJ047_03560 [Anaerolineae bacterium]|nr:hypothetical protein [Anaerolineae bacterium]
MPDDPKHIDDDPPPDRPDEPVGGSASPRAPWEEFAGQSAGAPEAGGPRSAPWDEFGAGKPPTYEEQRASSAPWESPHDVFGDLETLDWLTGEPEPAAPDAAPLSPAGEDWLGAFGQAAGYSRQVPAASEDDLTWLDVPDAPQPPAPQPDEAGEQPFPDDAEVLPDWLTAGAAEESPVQGEGLLPDWLLAEAPQPDELPPAQRHEQYEPAAGAERLSAEQPLEEVPDWLLAEAPGTGEPPAEQPPEEVPDWLFAEAPGAGEQPPAQSYEEWEREQRELAAEAEKTPEERLLEEVPDWFAQLDEVLPAPPPPDAATGEGPQFVPGWFLGLEEQAEEAPDWLRRMDLSTGPLEEPVAPEAAPAPAPSEPDVPDWFRGASGVDSIDWQVFGAGLEADETPAEMPPQAEPGEGALPAWMAGEAADDDRILAPEDIPFPDLELEQTPPPQAGEEAEIGDFVERFEPLEPEDFDRPAFAATGAASADMPDWLRELSASADSALGERYRADVEAAASSPPDTADALDWLEELSPEDVAPAEEYPLPPAPVVPAPPEDAPHTLETAPLDSAALDDLLGYEEEQPAAGPPFVLDSGDEALQDLEALFSGVSAERQAPDLQRLFDQDEMDRVLGDMLAPQEETAPSAEFSPLPPAEPPHRPPAPEPSAAPSWVEELRPSELPVTVKAGGAQASVRQKQVDELPERLRAFRAEALRELGDAQGEQAPAGGLLADIPGALPAADMVIPAAVGRRVAGQLVTTPDQERRVRRLQALLDIGAGEEDEEAALDDAARLAFAGLEPEELPTARRPRRPRRFKLDRLLVTLALLAALLGPFATDALHFAADPPPLAGNRAAVAGQVDALAAGDYVLFAFEYGPVSAGELDALAAAVLRDALARGAVPLTISTSPAGAFHAGSVIAALGDDALLLAARDQGETVLQAGEDYAALRYLPGEAVGVRSLTSVVWGAGGALERHPAFATDLRGDDSGLPITSLAEDIALIVVVGDESTGVRTWAEQLAAVPVPRVALVTAAIEPLAVPYVGETGYAGLLAGARDTARYNAERNAATLAPYQMPGDLPVELPAPPEARWHSIALGAAGAAGLIALGMVINLLRALGRRRRR